MTVRAKRRLFVLGIVVLAGLIFHGPLLRWSATCLIAEDAPSHGSSLGLLVWHNVPDGDRLYDVAAQWFRQRASRPAKILVFAPRPNRLEQLGVISSFDALSRRQLELRHIPQDAISTAPSDGNDDDWSTAHAVKQWLAAHPEESLILACAAFRSANLRWTLDAVLDRRQRARVQIQPLRDRRFDETNWWKSRSGFKAFGFNWLLRGYHWFHGSEASNATNADYRRYEAEVLRELPATTMPADYVMVLNGDENTRPFVAVALIRSGLAHQALITETKRIPLIEEAGMPPSHEINRQVLIHRGVDARRITILPAQAATTYDEARALAIFLDSRPQAHVFVVTNDFHLRRSRWIFDRIFGNHARQVTFVSAPSDGFSPDHWWCTEAGFLAVGSEWLKQIFYLALYGCAGLWLAACVALWIVAAYVRRREAACQPVGITACSRHSTARDNSRVLQPNAANTNRR